MNDALAVLNSDLYTINAGYLACARCSNTGALVLIEPVSTISGADQPLSRPKTERCSNCSGSGKVGHQILSYFCIKWQNVLYIDFFCLLLFCSYLPFLGGMSCSTGINYMVLFIYLEVCACWEKKRRVMINFEGKILQDVMVSHQDLQNDKILSLPEQFVQGQTLSPLLLSCPKHPISNGESHMRLTNGCGAAIIFLGGIKRWEFVIF